jgi:glucan biosynthesis protein
MSVFVMQSWKLKHGFWEFFELIDDRLTHDFIRKELKLDLENTDPETTIFNPATILSKVFNLAEKNYSKRQGEINSIISHLNKEDYQSFLDTEKCMSFNIFHNAIHENS